MTWTTTSRVAHGIHGRMTRMACDPDALVAAIDVADADDGGTLKLAPNCTYARTANQGGNGLPVPITIKGKDAISFASPTPLASAASTSETAATAADPARLQVVHPGRERKRRRPQHGDLRSSDVARGLGLFAYAGRGVARPPARSGDGGGR
jgi:hypothetical protein